MLRAAEDAAKRARVQYFAKRGLAEGAQRIYKQKAVAAEAAAGTSVVATHAAAQAENEFLAVKESLGHEYMRGVAGALNVAGSAGAAMELTPENFDTEVFESGKAAFVKFLAPW